LENLDEKILDVVQDGFPLEDHPYAALGKMFGLSEEQAFARVESLRECGVIRRLGGVYNSRKLGYISRLCAGVVPEGQLDGFVSEVNKIPAITHNYIRSHAYNVWFTIIARSETEIEETVLGLEAETALHDVHILSSKKMFKINTVMGRCAARKVVESAACFVPNEDDRRRIKLLSKDIPHTLTPLQDLGVQASEIQGDLNRGIMRRFGAILRHQQAGFDANAMVCFSVTDVERAGNMLAEDSHVSHCYERAPFERFPYNLYAMFHATSAGELQSVIEGSVDLLGNPDHVVLTSLKELKKTSFCFFEG